MQNQNQEQVDYARAIRGLEEKIVNLSRRVQVGEQNSLVQGKKMHETLRELNSEIKEINKQIAELKEKVDLIIKEMGTVAKKEEVEILKKYLNLWEPVNFVTQNEVDKLIKRAMEEKEK